MNYKYIKHRISKRYHRMINFFVRYFYRDIDREINRTIHVAGSARSGTTWLANVIASQFPSRIIFEPFNPQLVKEFSHFHNYLYMRPDDNSQELCDFVTQLFSGSIRNAWVDRQTTHLFPKRRIIKSVRASLMLKWLDNHFPEVPILFIIRHPCAVALSRMKLGWNPDEDIRDFLGQPRLMDDLLVKFIDLIWMANSAEEKNAIIWCITNIVPIMQFQAGHLNMIFYEDLVQNPEVEIPRMFHILGLPFNKSIFYSINRPSFTSTRTSAILTGKNLVENWKNELSTSNIDKILSIVDEFELSYLYENRNQ